ncbi:porin [Halofilum ochraceum]|uniref:porin n=1 Tax=Halofilum ochraceum TaxID=1611323 RepID=UPI0008366EBC|nr:porin [Halofilum ochraceum]
MTMKKSLIALAVSSAVVAPASVQAAEVYGSLNTTFESTSTDNGGVGALIYNTTDDEAGLGMSDTLESRFGVSGSEDLGNGLTAGYTFEFGIGTTTGVTGGSANEDSNVNTRLSNVSLSGDFGTVKLGTMWGVLYEYAGWNHYRTDGHGGATHYFMTNGVGFLTADDPSGLRVDNTVAYTYGGGGYSSDPFTFTVALRSKDNDGAANTFGSGGYAANDDEAIDNVTIGAQGTFGDFTVNGTFYSESNSDTAAGASTADPSMITLGGRWSSGPFYVGGTYFMADRDQQTASAVGDDPSAFNILGGMDFGSGYSGYLGVGAGDNDANNSDAGDMTTFFLQAQKEFSSRTKIYGEFETVEVDGGNASDPEQNTLAFGVKHSF